MPRPKGPEKKELRIQFTPEHFERLQKQADKLDMTMSALVRMWAMEKVLLLESHSSNSSIAQMMAEAMEIAEKQEKP